MVLSKQAPARGPADGEEIVWSGPEALEARLAEGPALLRVTGVPNARLAGDLAALSALDDSSRTADAPDPEVFHALGARYGHRTAVTWNGTADDGSLDIVFALGDTPLTGLYRPSGTVPHANRPAPFRDVNALMRTLRSYAADQLPEYMVPAAVVPLDRLPVTPSGKLDSAALPTPDYGALSAGRPPRDAREELLCAAYADVLGLRSATIDDDFFALGGDSITAIQLLVHARRAGLRLSSRDVFKHRTVAALAAAAGDVVREDAEPDTPLVALTEAELAEIQGTFPVTIGETLPLSPLQEGFYFHSLVDGADLDAYVVQQALELTGPVDGDALRRAAQRVLDRHAPLRACFRRRPDGQPVQIIAAGLELPWREVDLTVHDGPARTPLADAVAAAERARRFDLAQSAAAALRADPPRRAPQPTAPDVPSHRRRRLVVARPAPRADGLLRGHPGRAAAARALQRPPAPPGHRRPRGRAHGLAYGPRRDRGADPARRDPGRRYARRARADPTRTVRAGDRPAGRAGARTRSDPGHGRPGRLGAAHRAAHGTPGRGVRHDRLGP